MKAYGQAFARTRDPVWLVAQGQAAKDAGDAGGALRIWDRAVAEDPTLSPAHEARVRLRLELVAARPTPQQSMALQSAATALQESQKDDDNALAHFGLGKTEQCDVEVRWCEQRMVRRDLATTQAITMHLE